MKVSDLTAYQSEFLSGTEMAELGPATATIEGVTLEEFYRTEEPLLVLSFVGKRKRLVLNKTRAAQMVGLGGDDTEAWPGLVVRLIPATQSGKRTIHIVSSNGR